MLTYTKFFKDGDIYRKEQSYPMLSIVDIYDIMCDELRAMLENKSRCDELRAMLENKSREVK